MAALFHSGQVCVASKRLYIHQDIYDQFVATMVETMKVLTIGEPDSLLGPIQNKMQYDRINRFLTELSSGDGKQDHTLVSTDLSFGDRTGYFIGPHIVSEPKHDSAIVTEEQFGNNNPPFVVSKKKKTSRLTSFQNRPHYSDYKMVNRGRSSWLC